MRAHRGDRARGDRTLLEGALGACQGLTGLGLRLHGRTKGQEGHADIVEVIAPGARPVRFAGLARPALRADTLGAVVDLAGGLPYPPLLAAPHVNPQAAERARELGVAFVDLAGNAHLRGPGLYVFVTGQRPVAKAGRPRATQAFTPAGLRVVFALLLDPRLLTATYREIGAAAEVALGTVAAVLEGLVEGGHLTPEGTAERRLLAPQQLAEEWVLLYPLRLRPKLVVGRFTAPDPEWWQTARIDPRRAVWGGEVAADRLTGRLKPGRQTLYVWGPPDEILLANRLRPDERGEVEILEAFWRPAEKGDTVPAEVAPPILAYADLMGTGDLRNVEVARLVRERHLRGVLGPA
jgi:hypothetical protein